MSNSSEHELRPADKLVNRFQQALLALALASGAFLVAELAALRHWNATEQLIPFAVLAVMVVSALVLAFVRGRFSVIQARLVALITIGASLYGLFEHVSANLDTGVLNSRYDWAAMAGWEHLWLAISGAVGGSPALAPLALGLAGVLLGLATMGRTTRKTA
ncbi:hypothetical protein NGTWS0302_17840 [Mycolicibacterium cyprinidarum]|uniref:Uncharacterized protein n=1 Tax=Mycolicibacterium cyprinidarum TaxID=2860311 RepID=A0ABQ4V8H3_9MYCO|nr:hypothetical protein NGTWS1702_12550 [Mycolicibacterium sp. NGTWSNA01]GJF19147.1 hypothetical protein NGTWS0302_17840 [Mycolicibacterium sp. NGTWS0302]GJF19751.1 hypothetical protein NGTWS1803_09800 [Mycolicibacterium sp. NGTWS1803]